MIQDINEIYEMLITLNEEWNVERDYIIISFSECDLAVVVQTVAELVEFDLSEISIHESFHDYIMRLQPQDTQYLGGGNWFFGQIRPTKLFEYILDGGIDYKLLSNEND